MSVKQTVLKWLRKAGAMRLVDKLYFAYNKLKYQRKNAVFLRSHSSFALSPAYMLYEANNLSYGEYFADGQTKARDIVKELRPFVHFKNASLLEWGCGPARIVRHIPHLLPHTQNFWVRLQSRNNCLE